MLSVKNGKIKINDVKSFNSFLNEAAYGKTKLVLKSYGETSKDDVYYVYGGEFLGYVFEGSLSELLDFGIFLAKKINKRNMKKEGGFNRVDSVKIGQYERDLTTIRFEWAK